MKKLSTSIVKKIKRILPEMREEVLKEFPKWHEYTAGSRFYSDEKVIEYLPSSCYEYTIIFKKIYTDRELAFYCLNNLTDEYLREVVSHTLKRLALLDSFIDSDKEGAYGVNIKPSQKKTLKKSLKTVGV